MGDATGDSTGDSLEESLNKRSALPGCFGHCVDCGEVHSLPVGHAHALASDVMREFETIQRLDYLVSEEFADPRFAFANLFSEGQGRMFGVLECEDAEGKTVVLRAFSSLTGGIRQIDGWVMPVLSVEVSEKTIVPAQREIRRLTAEMRVLQEGAEGTQGEAKYKQLKAARKAASQQLWKEMCAAYRFANFRGEERALEDTVLPGTPIVGGIGECCAPKLLHHAARNGLRPISLAEFYWGNGNDHGGRVSGELYPCCESRCQPILGFLLCGLNG